mmetsp:Transcript_47619/g.110300  ORF Transcript_47619/g.110300 Transcript_47619/m.110300 type:complete len:423 (-) Transcript_47619:59-1327(-)
MVPRHAASPLRASRRLLWGGLGLALLSVSTCGPTAFWSAVTFRPTHAVTRLAATAAAPTSLSEAGVFLTEVDAITGDVDVSGLPEAMGVYAVYDAESKLQYIGLSKQISKSVENHAQSLGAEAGTLIASVKVLEMPDQPKEALKATWERWVKEHMDSGGEIPAGNLPENAVGADRRWRSRASQGKPPLNLGGVRGITTMAEALEAVKEAVASHPVVLFMKGTPAMPQCGFSARSVGIMNSVGVPFDTVNVLDDVANTGVREAVKQFSNWPTIPQLFVNGELVGGADIIGEMYESGKLESALKSSPTSGSEVAKSTAPISAGKVAVIDDPGRPVASSMSRILSEVFQLHTLQIVDESSQHEGDAGALEMGLTGESHFKVEIAAQDFEGLSPVQRQKKVFDALSDVMPRIHALSLVTRTPAEVS